MILYNCFFNSSKLTKNLIGQRFFFTTNKSIADLINVKLWMLNNDYYVIYIFWIFYKKYSTAQNYIQHSILKLICQGQLPSQSALTILVLKTWVGLWPWKKSCPKYGPEKSRVQKNRVIVIQKENRLCNNDPGFLHTAVCNPYFGHFFKVPDPKKISG